jgi:hypothetical protein
MCNIYLFYFIFFLIDDGIPANNDDPNPKYIFSNVFPQQPEYDHPGGTTSVSKLSPKQLNKIAHVNPLPYLQNRPPLGNACASFFEKNENEKFKNVMNINESSDCCLHDMEQKQNPMRNQIPNLTPQSMTPSINYTNESEHIMNQIKSSSDVELPSIPFQRTQGETTIQQQQQPIRDINLSVDSNPLEPLSLGKCSSQSFSTITSSQLSLGSPQQWGYYTPLYLPQLSPLCEVSSPHPDDLPISQDLINNKQPDPFFLKNDENLKVLLGMSFFFFVVKCNIID